MRYCSYSLDDDGLKRKDHDNDDDQSCVKARHVSFSTPEVSDSKNQTDDDKCLKESFEMHTKAD